MSRSNSIVFERKIVHSPAFLDLTGVSAQVFFLFLAPNSRGFGNFQNPTFPPDFQKSHFFCKEKLFLVPPNRPRRFKRPRK